MIGEAGGVLSPAKIRRRVSGEEIEVIEEEIEEEIEEVIEGSLPIREEEEMPRRERGEAGVCDWSELANRVGSMMATSPLRWPRR